MVPNTTVTEATGLPPVSDIINIHVRRSALFGHIRLGKPTLAHRALKLADNALCSRRPAAGAPHQHPGCNLAVRSVTHHGSDR